MRAPARVTLLGMDTAQFVLEVVVAIGTLGAAGFAGWAALVAARTAKTAETQSKAALEALELQRDTTRDKAAEQARRVRYAVLIAGQGGVGANEWMVFVRNRSNEPIFDVQACAFESDGALRNICHTARLEPGQTVNAGGAVDDPYRLHFRLWFRDAVGHRWWLESPGFPELTDDDPPLGGVFHRSVEWMSLEKPAKDAFVPDFL